MSPELLGWRFELGGIGRCCLVQRVQGYFISGLGVVGCVPLLPGVTGHLTLNALAFSVVRLLGHLTVVFVSVLVLSGIVLVPIGYVRGLSCLVGKWYGVGWMAGVSSAR